MPDVALLANGARLGGWTSLNIRKGLDQVADEFRLELTNHRVGARGQIEPTGITDIRVRTTADELSDVDECVVQIDGETIITGYIDEKDFDYDARTVQFRISGRSKAGDLLDCSAIHKSGVWKNVPLWQIAHDLCQPFGVEVVDYDPSDGKHFNRFKLEPGETVMDAIMRATDMRSMLLVSRPDGNVELTRASIDPTGATLRRGENIISGGLSWSGRDRFSKYIFTGQTAASDNWSGEKVSNVRGEVEDPEVVRYRPLKVLGQKQGSNEDLGRRAVWERNVRAGRSLRYRCTVEDWTTDNGLLWRPNMLVHVDDDWCGIQRDLLVCSVDLVLSTERIASLELVDRGTFDPAPTARRPRPKVTLGPIVFK